MSRSGEKPRTVLSAADASVRDSLTLVEKLIDLEQADVVPYQGVLKPVQVAAIREAQNRS